MILTEKPVKKDSPYWSDFVKNIWEEFGHPKDDTEPAIKSWRSREEEAGL